MMTFSLRFKELREEKNLSQRAIAQELGFSPSTVGMWESGKREPDFKTTNELAQYFNVTIDFLLGRTDRRTHKVAWGKDMYDDFKEMRTRESKEAQLAFLKHNGTPDDLTSAHETLLKEVSGAVNSESDGIAPELLDLCHQLNPSGQKKVTEYARDLLDNDKYKSFAPAKFTESAG